MENLQQSHKLKRKISILLEDENWTIPERNNIDLALTVVVSATSTKYINTNYDGDIESNDGVEQAKFEKRQRVIRKSSTQFDYYHQETKKNYNTVSNSSKSSNSIQNVDYYDYTSIYQSCRYHYNENVTNDDASKKVVSLSGSENSCSTETIQNATNKYDNDDKTEPEKKSEQNHSESLHFESPIIAVQTLSLGEAIGFSSDARIVVEATFPYRAVHANGVFRKLFSFFTEDLIGLPLSHIMPTVLSDTPSDNRDSSPAFSSDLESFLLDPIQSYNSSSKSQQQRIRTVFHMITDGPSSNNKKMIPLMSSFNGNYKVTSVLKEASKLGILCSHYMIQCENCDSCDFSHTNMAIA